MIFLPLDDRPCNLLFVVMLMAMAGSHPTLWERYDGVEAKHRTGPPPIRTLNAMTLPSHDGPVLISLNTLAAGGLVGSRTADPVHLPVPTLPEDGLYHFVVPRLEPTATDEATKEGYREVRKFLNGTNSTGTNGQMRVLKVLKGDAPLESLPVGSIREWVTRTEGWYRWIEALRLPKDRLLITFDDSTPGPLAGWLHERYGWFSDHVVDGADEGGMLLAARAIREQTDITVRAGVLYSNPAGASKRGRYESLSLANLIRAEAEWLGVTLVPASALKPGEPLVLIHNWTTVQGDRHTSQSALPNPFPTPLSDLLDAHVARPLYVADIAYANGGDPTFATSLHARMESGQADLRAYAGWNTAANSLGTTLAVLTVDQCAVTTSAGVRWRETFRTARFLDDVLYQSKLRQDIENQLRTLDGNPWALSQDQTVRFANEMTRNLRQGAYERDWIPAPSAWSLSLPWERSFEATITTPEMRQLIADTPRCQ